MPESFHPPYPFPYCGEIPHVDSTSDRRILSNLLDKINSGLMRERRKDEEIVQLKEEIGKLKRKVASLSKNSSTSSKSPSSDIVKKANMKSAMHTSFTTIRKFVRDVLKVKISRGQLAKLIDKAGRSLAIPYDELLKRIPLEQKLNIDETGHKDNGDIQEIHERLQHRCAVLPRTSNQGHSLSDHPSGQGRERIREKTARPDARDVQTDSLQR